MNSVSENKLLTIFTPTFNREKLLCRVYESLKKQTNKDFVWLIVDDGSTDSTKDIIEKFVQEDILNIKYIYQTNQGKMQAHNLGVVSCDTEYIVCLDSDDQFPENAVQFILNSIEKCEIKNCAGIIGYKCKSESKKDLLGVFPNIKYSNLTSLYYSGFKGETTLIFKKEILLNYLFPKFDNEKFITEAYIYDQIDRKYIFYILQEILTIYEYQEDGLSNTIYHIMKNNPLGYREYWKQKLKFDLEDRKYKQQIISATHYVQFSLTTHKKILMGLSMHAIILVILCFPLGVIKYLELIRKG